MKKNMLSAIVVAFTITIMLIPSVYAANQSMTTTATVTFTGMAQTQLTPVNPNDPDKPMDKTNPDIPGNQAPDDKAGLRLIAAPNFNFGTYDLKDGINLKRNPIPDSNNSYNMYAAQVSDTRNSNKGWQLRVSNTQFKNTKSNTVLTGAIITLAKPAVTNSAQADTTKPVTNNVAYVGSATILNGQDTTTIMNITPGKDAGNLTTSINWQPKDVTLTAPVGNITTGDTFTSSVIWTLISAQ